ncbi:MerR family transcriptional regulator [Geobacillus subterraneus]|uniref:MerR family transcriptional regulator n=2 Tax=Geobacillus TaxID=129337 RepID=A0ABM6AB21_9BACL|nr:MULTISPECIES: MerR family transcriptional regulator [Geobacillus]AMX83478.1 MerR family transcriptional regulator [Geobacillus subterraneus]KZS26501.1 MerR family transcriptional regulator [Geobacillus subterraneus]OXB90502.1 MerR family DNA-binding transcriptional regulator [Geobacillus uzenensis]WPZ16892.1 MerR family transcriptional regulator [Geobacillus subterraneus]
MTVNPHEENYKQKKVISIGIVSELTGLSPRQIRYYEERKLVFPDRSKGIRKYSFADVEQLMRIADQREEGVSTYEIRQEMTKELRERMLKGQMNAHFRLRS